MSVVEEKMVALKTEIAKLQRILTDPEKRARINESVTIDDLDKINEQADLIQLISLEQGVLNPEIRDGIWEARGVAREIEAKLNDQVDKFFCLLLRLIFFIDVNKRKKTAQFESIPLTDAISNTVIGGGVGGLEGGTWQILPRAGDEQAQ